MNQLFPGIAINKYVFLTGVLTGKKGDRGRYVLRRREYLLLPLYPILHLWGVYLYRRARNRERQRQPVPYQYNLAIAVIAKNESAYIAEWLVYHKLQGVEVVFLYDNDSTDNMREVLEPFIAEGFVVYNQIHGIGKQYEAYSDMVKRYGRLCKYMAFIDCDEFLVPMRTGDRLLDLIESAFAKDENAGGLGINWCIYGSAGYEQKPEGLVIEHFNRHSQVDFDWNDFIKSVVIPSRVESFNHAHFPIYKKGFYPINLQGKFCPMWWNAITAYEGLRVNHYICKSKAEYVTRRKLGNAIDGTCRPMEEFYFFDRNEVADTTMARYIEDVKRQLAP